MMAAKPKADNAVYRLKPGNITYDRHGVKRFGGAEGDDIELTDEAAKHLRKAGVIE